MRDERDDKDRGAPWGRWIRPATEEAEETLPGVVPADLVERFLVSRARRRITDLTALERQLETRIRARWNEAEARLRVEEEKALEARALSMRETKQKLESELDRARRDGHGEGFRKGFEEGKEEGRRRGFEQGLVEGREQGREEGRRLEQRRAAQEIRGAVKALEQAAGRLDEERRAFQREAHKNVARLVLEVARKLVKREVEVVGDPALRNLEKAVDLVFRRGQLVVELNPRDIALVKEALDGRPRWAEDFDSVEVRPAADIERGGCRIIAGSGLVDLTLDTQLGLIEEALSGAPMAPCDERSPDAAGGDGR